MTARPLGNSQVIPSLDGFRACSIIIVAASHCGLGTMIPGGLGVTIFFFLSGFLITTLMMREVDATGTISIPHFYLRRALRLYPPLIFTLVIAYSLVYLHLLGGGVSLPGALSQLFYFANYYQLFFDPGQSVPEGTGILWSLAVEEHFYLAYPILVVGFLCRRHFLPLIAVLTGLCIAALLWRMHLVAAPGFVTPRTYYASDTRFDSILFGCIFALVRRILPADQRTSQNRLRYWFMLLAGLGGLVVSLALRGTYFRETLRYTLQGLSLMPIFYFALAGGKNIVVMLLNSKIAKRIGVYSYSIYLFHFIFLSLLTELTAHRSWTLPNPWVLFVLIFGGSCGYAFIVDTLVDPYFRSLRKRFH